MRVIYMLKISSKSVEVAMNLKQLKMAKITDFQR